MSKRGVLMQKHLAAVHQQSLDCHHRLGTQTWEPQPNCIHCHQTSQSKRTKTTKRTPNISLLHSCLWTAWLRYSSFYFTISLAVSLAVCKDPLQCQKRKIFPTMQWKKPAERDKGACKRPRWGNTW